MGVPKVKSAFATSVVMANAKTNTSEIVFFILLSFQSLSLLNLSSTPIGEQGTVNIFTPHTMRSFSGLGLSL
jgi:hypothetical protein